MDEATFRILDTLSMELGNTLSIHQLTSKIKQNYGTGYYARTYNKLIDLSKQGLIQLSKAGRSSIPSLNFSSYALLDMLSEIDMRKKRQFLDRFKNTELLLLDLETHAHNNPQIESISIIDAERNAKLNRAELLFLLHDMNSDNLPDRSISIYNTIRDFQDSRNIRIDALPLTTKRFRDLLTSNEINPLKEMLRNRITFYNPSSFWLNISEVLSSNSKIIFEKTETNPLKMTDAVIYSNLLRFGYRELGIAFREDKLVCIESVIAAIMTRGTARLIDAIPIILVKNKTNYHLLIFLSEKYGFSDELLGLLKTLAKLKPSIDTEDAIHILQSLGLKGTKVNEKTMEHNMRLYHAIR
jgi:hypothetical protein